MTTHTHTISKKLLLTSCIAISIALGGCSSTGLEDWNRGTQSFNDGVDSAILKPVAKGYTAITPDVVDTGISNFFSNLRDIGVSVNDLLQLKLLQSGMDLGRFIVNTTAGVGGFVDVASMVDLPKHDEDFGQTLGFWGVPAGPYLVLPFFGPSSPRDAVGLVGDAALHPLTYVSIFGGTVGSAASAGAKAVNVTNRRAELMSTEKVLNEGAIDRYEFIKNSYQQNREYLVHDGNPPNTDVDLDDSNDSDTGKKATNNAPTSNGASKHNLKLTAPK